MATFDFAGLASTYESLLPRTLDVFEGTQVNKRTSSSDFLDIDIFGDLDHIPVVLKREMKKEIRVMNGYSQVFGCIVRSLDEGRLPCSAALERDILYSSCGRNEDAKLFLQAGGSSRHAINYLFDRLKKIIKEGHNLEEGLRSLVFCANDFKRQTSRKITLAHQD